MLIILREDPGMYGMQGMGGHWYDPIVSVVETPVKIAYSTTKAAATSLYNVGRSAVTNATSTAAQAVGQYSQQPAQQPPAQVYYTPPPSGVIDPSTGQPYPYQPLPVTPVQTTTPSNMPLILGGVAVAGVLLLLLRRRSE
jgi:hypothetical protein